MGKKKKQAQIRQILKNKIPFGRFEWYYFLGSQEYERLLCVCVCVFFFYFRI
jgi:hypothetical protein